MFQFRRNDRAKDILPKHPVFGGASSAYTDPYVARFLPGPKTAEQISGLWRFAYVLEMKRPSGTDTPENLYVFIRDPNYHLTPDEHNHLLADNRALPSATTSSSGDVPAADLRWCLADTAPDILVPAGLHRPRSPDRRASSPHSQSAEPTSAQSVAVEATVIDHSCAPPLRPAAPAAATTAEPASPTASFTDAHIGGAAAAVHPAARTCRILRQRREPYVQSTTSTVARIKRKARRTATPDNRHGEDLLRPSDDGNTLASPSLASTAADAPPLNLVEAITADGASARKRKSACRDGSAAGKLKSPRHGDNSDRRTKSASRAVNAARKPEAARHHVYPDRSSKTTRATAERDGDASAQIGGRTVSRNAHAETGAVEVRPGSKTNDHGNADQPDNDAPHHPEVAPTAVRLPDGPRTQRRVDTVPIESCVTDDLDEGAIADATAVGATGHTVGSAVRDDGLPVQPLDDAAAADEDAGASAHGVRVRDELTEQPAATHSPNTSRRLRRQVARNRRLLANANLHVESANAPQYVRRSQHVLSTALALADGRRFFIAKRVDVIPFHRDNRSAPLSSCDQLVHVERYLEAICSLRHAAQTSQRTMKRAAALATIPKDVLRSSGFDATSSLIGQYLVVDPEQYAGYVVEWLAVHADELNRDIPSNAGRKLPAEDHPSSTISMSRKLAWWIGRRLNHFYGGRAAVLWHGLESATADGDFSSAVILPSRKRMRIAHYIARDGSIDEATGLYRVELARAAWLTECQRRWAVECEERRAAADTPADALVSFANTSDESALRVCDFLRTISQNGNRPMAPNDRTITLARMARYIPDVWAQPPTPRDEIGSGGTHPAVERSAARDGHPAYRVLESMWAKSRGIVSCDRIDYSSFVLDKPETPPTYYSE